MGAHFGLTAIRISLAFASIGAASGAVACVLGANALKRDYHPPELGAEPVALH